MQPRRSTNGVHVHARVQKRLHLHYAGWTILAVTRIRPRRHPARHPRNAAAGAVARPPSGVFVLLVVNTLLGLLFLAAALLAQPGVAAIAGTACVTVALQLARQLRP